MRGLTQRLPLDRTQPLHSLHQGGELLLEGERGHRTAQVTEDSRLIFF
jgi:hypothetical protein